MVDFKRMLACQCPEILRCCENRELDCVLVWKFDRFVCSTRHLLTALEEFNHLGRPSIPKHIIHEIERLAASTDLSVRKIHAKIAGKANRGAVGEITKQVRALHEQLIL